jgi:hypothetical protein
VEQRAMMLAAVEAMAQPDAIRLAGCDQSNDAAQTATGE